jgi:hypothetical protein
LVAKIWWQARERFGLAPVDAIEEEPKQPIPDILYRLPADFKVPGAPPSVKWSATEEGREEEQIEFSWVGETARHVGTVVHRWLQRIADDSLRGWDAARVDALKARFANELRRRGVPSDQLKGSAEVVARALKNSISDERGRWVLGAHPESRTEYRLRAPSESGIRNYVIDRIFRDEGHLWIVDYKTSRHEGADMEKFLDRERDRYAPQMASYGRLRLESRQGLYFPLLRGWREVER